MTTIDEIVMSMMEGSPDFDKPMTIEEAIMDVKNLIIDASCNDEELPEDLTPERYMEVWNGYVEKYRRINSEEA